MSKKFYHAMQLSGIRPLLIIRADRNCELISGRIIHSYKFFYAYLQKRKFNVRCFSLVPVYGNSVFVVLTRDSLYIACLFSEVSFYVYVLRSPSCSPSSLVSKVSNGICRTFRSQILLSRTFVFFERAVPAIKLLF